MPRPELERVAFRVPPEQAGQRLDEALSRALRVSKSQSRKLIVVGVVRVDGRAVRQPGRSLAVGARVEALVRRAALRSVADVAFEVSAATVLYEDELLIALDKPAGLPTAPTVDASRPSVVAAVKRYLGGSAYVGIHQRLDRETSGVVLFAKDRRANSGLSRAFAERAVVKVYAALTGPARRGQREEWTADDRLSLGERVRVVQREGLSARTHFRVERRLRSGLLVEARPLTGRKHQIRVQLAAAGLPILGDRLYGGPGEVEGTPVSRVMLHARRLELAHPVTGGALVIESRLPEDFLRMLR